MAIKESLSLRYYKLGNCQDDESEVELFFNWITHHCIFVSLHYSHLCLPSQQRSYSLSFHRSGRGLVNFDQPITWKKNYANQEHPSWKILRYDMFRKSNFYFIMCYKKQTHCWYYTSSMKMRCKTIQTGEQVMQKDRAVVWMIHTCMTSTTRHKRKLNCALYLANFVNTNN